jgi:hypothetical protein
VIGDVGGLLSLDLMQTKRQLGIRKEIDIGRRVELNVSRDGQSHGFGTDVVVEIVVDEFSLHEGRSCAKTFEKNLVG